jgi:glycolate oxidase FAD binding subunit
MTRFQPADLAELRDAVAAALAAGEPVEIVGGGSKRALGRPLQTPHLLDLSRLSGVRDYAPSELVLTAGAATPLAEIERALAEYGQMLSFEPPDWRALLGTKGEPPHEPTIGGALGCNLSGPRRIKAGAARDHFLGFRGVSGRGESFKAGGKVVKNVTGYDLCKLMTGSYGTLAALEEVTVKVLPRPETVATVLFSGVAPDPAVRLMSMALGSPHEVSGAAYLPAGTAGLHDGRVALRVEGPAPSVGARRNSLLAEHRGAGSAEILGEAESAALWRAIGEVAPLLEPGERAVWRISVAPSRGAELAETLTRALGAKFLLDWGGGLVWIAVPENGDAGAETIRRAIRGADGRGNDGHCTGHATLVKGSAALRRAVAVFEPQPAPLAALSHRVKEAFDPAHILNPGRMVPNETGDT